MKPDGSTVSDAADVMSEPLVFPGRSGLKIAAFWDHRHGGGDGCPFVVLAPKYGETKKNNLQLAYQLAANGLNVLRFDHTCHVGESAGVKTSFTLEQGLGDIQACYDFLQERFKVGSAALLANSLSVRPAIRAAAIDSRVSLVVGVVGVVNVQGTLAAIYREDVVANYAAGKRWGVTDSFFGHEGDWDLFIKNAIATGMHDLEGTHRDLAAIRVPILFFCGDDDAWVDIAEVRAAATCCRRARVVQLPGGKHEVRENHAVAALAFREIVSTVIQEAWGLDEAPRALRAPDQRRLLAQNRLERQRLRESLPAAQSETEFWTGYLGRYVLLEHVDEYHEYLDLVGDLIGPVLPGEAVLDAGCGNGLFGVWLLRRLKHTPDAPLPAFYVGLDLADRGLSDAFSRHGGVAAERLRRAAGEAGCALTVAYARADFDRLSGHGGAAAMPRFADAAFDAVCCSLVLSYLVEPLRLLHELRRLLRPGGRIVVSSMKPHCDISTIYRDFVDGRTSRVEIESARDLLSGVGQIKLKEEQGVYVFFSGEELSELVSAAGFRQVQVFASFGNQAYVVRAVA